jgi:AraC-like DNA-binding protein
MSSTRRLALVRLDESALDASPVGEEPARASQSGAAGALALRVSGLLERAARVGRGQTLELWLVEVSPEQGAPERAGSCEGARHAAVDAGGGNSARDGAVRRALELMDRDVKTRWTVASLARAVGLSRAAFARRFAAALGASPIAHLTALRLSRAARSLSSGDASLAEVAAEVGYDSEFAFNRAFKRFHGVPPAAFRRRQRSFAEVVPEAGPTEAVLEVGLLEVGLLDVGASEAGASELERLPRLTFPPRCLALAA